MKKLLLASIVPLALMGCAPNPVVPIYKYQNVVTVLPKSYTGHCVVKTQPPAKEAFVKASKDERINMLLKSTAGLLVDIQTCDNRWDQVDIWNSAQLKIYGNDPTAVFPGQTPPAAQGASAVAPSK